MQTGTATSSAVHLHFDVVPGSTFKGPVHVCISLLAHTVQYGKGSVPTPALSTWTSQSTWVRGMNRVRGLDGMKGRSMGSLRPELTRTNPRRSNKCSRARTSYGLYERATFTYRLGDRYRYYCTILRAYIKASPQFATRQESSGLGRRNNMYLNPPVCTYVCTSKSMPG